MQERLIQLLETIAGAPSPLNVADLAQLTGVPRATIYRNITSLMECGFVDEAECGHRYVLGMRFIKIAFSGKSDKHVINATAAYLTKLVKILGETTFLARYRGGRVDIVHIDLPSDPAQSYIYPGLGERPAHACSSAKVIAAFIAHDLRNDLLAAPFAAFTDKTITDIETMQRELTQIQEQGYAVCDAEIGEGISSVAVPVCIARLGAMFSFGVVGPSLRIREKLKAKIVPNLKELAVPMGAAIQHCSTMDAELMHANLLAPKQDQNVRAH